MPSWDITELTGYVPKTTFWQDFSIADNFGISAVRDTYTRAMGEWKENHIFLTELVMVLNHKIWQHFQTNQPLARVYDELWRDADSYAVNHLTGDEMEYFYQITD